MAVLELVSEKPAESLCGFYVECNSSWSASQVEESAALWDPSNRSHAFALQQRHEAMRAACGVQNTSASRTGSSGRVPLASGSWCLSAPTKHPSKHNPTGGRVLLALNQSYRLPHGYVAADGIIVGTLAMLLRNRIPWLAARIQSVNGLAARDQSVNDFGAGMGSYGRALSSLSKTPFDYRGYDGAGNVEEAASGTGPPGSERLVHFFDLSLPLSLPRADWVLSVEVGEHIPSVLPLARHVSCPPHPW